MVEDATRTERSRAMGGLRRANGASRPRSRWESRGAVRRGSGLRGCSGGNSSPGDEVVLGWFQGNGVARHRSVALRELSERTLSYRWAMGEGSETERQWVLHGERGCSSDEFQGTGVRSSGRRG